MKGLWLATAAAVLLVIGPAAAGSAQEEDFSLGRGWGAGVRLFPHAVMPLIPSDIDPALNTVVFLQHWFKGSLGFEAGGWLSSFSDNWSSRSLLNLFAGVLFKLAEGPRLDPYLAGRAISLQVFRRDSYIVCETPPAEGSSRSRENEPLPPCWPWGFSESRTSTLAVEAAAGLEWSLARELATSFELALVYAQTMTTTIATPAARESEPVSKANGETLASTSLGLTLTLSLSFYPALGQR
ncbi:MAG: hypothetical protein NUW06_05735 [Candidatus Acetothermia bacterium]|jgi:hypothetical protein|nr:hypothetical protein [Candidatus Acetothermia bacterium]MDH7505785.1 hypothetical protein [Candidatus Acetothermia bacterium]